MQRARRALASSLGLIECSRRVVETSEASGALRPARTTRALQRASGWLAESAARLETAGRSLQEATDSIVLAPDRADDLPARVVEATAHIIGIMFRLMETSERLDDTFAEISDAAADGTMLPDPSLYRRPAVVAARIPFGRPLVPKWPSCVHIPVITIHIRRRRTAPRTVAEPSKRVSRGRAPPFFSPASFTAA
jgi:hypothetical protein